MDNHKEFKIQCEIEIEKQGKNKTLKKITSEWFNEASKTNYSYHFE